MTELPLPTTPASAVIPPVVKSEELLKGGQELIITHEGETYRLRITRNNKLILTK